MVRVQVILGAWVASPPDRIPIRGIGIVMIRPGGDEADVVRLVHIKKSRRSGLTGLDSAMMV
tara:strand:- start:447 stop:632 length:186 start_codon:yes stop_codon:yes gene_type:complete